MTRRYRTNALSNEQRLERWINDMAERPEESPHWRHYPSRHLKVEHISAVVMKGEAGDDMWYLAVISRLEDDDEL